MALKISSKRLDKIAGKQPASAPPSKAEVHRKTTAPEPRPSTPDPNIAQAMKAAEASAAAAERASEGLFHTLQQLREMTLLNAGVRHEATSKRPVRMVVVRDQDGLIEYIDVVDQSAGMH